MDTLMAIRHAREQHSRVLAICNTNGSTIPRESDAVVYTHGGPEIGVASTKAFTCQLASLASFAIAAGVARGNLSESDEKKLCASLLETPRHMAEFLKQEAMVKQVAEEVAKARDVLYMGRGASYPLALEGALKLKEISYIHAEGYAAGEMKHGPIALIDEAVPIIVLAPHDVHFEKTISNMQEVMARGGKVLLISDKHGIAKAGNVWASIEVPATNAFITPLLYAIPVQLLAYYAAIAKGTDVDQPRNLAKSVTVE
jgi:glucosamine--fructose-6-phosphate aminotransferase (isomerizing)